MRSGSTGHRSCPFSFKEHRAKESSLVTVGRSKSIFLTLKTISMKCPSFLLSPLTHVLVAELGIELLADRGSSWTTAVSSKSMGSAPIWPVGRARRGKRCHAPLLGNAIRGDGIPKNAGPCAYHHDRDWPFAEIYKQCTMGRMRLFVLAGIDSCLQVARSFCLLRVPEKEVGKGAKDGWSCAENVEDIVPLKVCD